MLTHSRRENQTSGECGTMSKWHAIAQIADTIGAVIIAVGFAGSIAWMVVGTWR